MKDLKKIARNYVANINARSLASASTREAMDIIQLAAKITSGGTVDDKAVIAALRFLTIGEVSDDDAMAIAAIIRDGKFPTQAKKAPRFRAFTSGDWQTFAGCETEKPIIAEYKTPCGVYVSLVVDGVDVQAHTIDDSDNTQSWGHEYPTPEIAKMMGDAILENGTFEFIMKEMTQLC